MKFFLTVSLAWLVANIALATANAQRLDDDASSHGKRIEFAAISSRVVGVWTLHSIYEEDDYGEDIDQFDTDPKGQLSFDGDGRFFFAIIGYDLKFRSGNRLQGSRFENAAVTQLNLIYYGIYQINAAGNEVMLRIERSSFPNWNGLVRTASFTVDGGKLDIRSGSIVSSLTGAGSSHSVWMRAK